MIRIMALLVALGASIVVYAVASSNDPSTLNHPANPVSFIDEETAARLIANDTLVVDVRTEREWDDGHIASALHIPFREIAETLPASADSETPVLLYCKVGGRAAHAAKELEALGYQAIYVLKAAGYQELQRALDSYQTVIQ